MKKLLTAFKRGAFFILCLFGSIVSLAQTDSLVLKNGNVIVGEIKSLDKGVLTIETPYSKSDFTIEWSGIKEIYSKSKFLVSLTDGKRLNGTLQTAPDGKKIIVETIEGQKIETQLADVVYLKGVKSDFWSRASASIDLGFSLTKANNVRQFSVRSNLGYLADRWQLNLAYDDLRSSQDSVEDTKRTETGVSFRYFLANDWFLAASLNFLSNTEQAIDLRTTGKIGAGKYFVHTNRAYFGLPGGLAFNNESFTNGTDSRSSLKDM